ncbi:MAG: TlpA family protein disulfide reductase [Alphaproteobacteria bacterium]|nr:TlpA family protein disulfide reductase [Alphaproteobacteria bacterium]
MRLNIIIAVCIGLAAYALTMHFEGRSPEITQAPVKLETKASGEVAPEFSFTDTNGKAHNIRDFEGKLVILNFWASWCPPCVKEFPIFLNAAELHKDDVVFVALSSDHDPEAMNSFVSKLELENADNVYIALDENTAITGGLFQTFRLPETIILNGQQEMIHKLVGADWSYEELDTLIGDHLMHK